MGVSRLSFNNRGRHFFFNGRTCFLRRNEHCTSYSDGKHLKMTNKHLSSAIVIMNMQNKITPIRLQIVHDIIMKTSISRFLLLQFAFPFFIKNPRETAYRLNKQKVVCKIF